jgi:hypothetical protein
MWKEGRGAVANRQQQQRSVKRQHQVCRPTCGQDLYGEHVHVCCQGPLNRKGIYKKIPVEVCPRSNQCTTKDQEARFYVESDGGGSCPRRQTNRTRATTTCMEAGNITCTDYRAKDLVRRNKVMTINTAVTAALGAHPSLVALIGRQGH